MSYKLAGFRNKKSVREKIREQKEWLQVTLSSIGDAVIATDTKGIILFINQVAEELTGYHGEDALGKNIEAVFNIISEETGLAAAIPIHKVLSDGIIVGLANHTALISKSGTIYSIADSAAPIKNNDGEIIGVVMVFRNETEKKRAERQVRDSEARFRELFNHMSSGVAVYEARQEIGGIDFIIKDFNRAAERIEEVSKLEIIDCNLKEVFPGVVEFGLMDVLEKVWGDGNPRNHPVAFYEDDRIKGWRDNYVYKLPSGEVVVVYDDVTERKQAEEILIRYQLVFENARDILLMVRLDGQIIDANLAALSVYGYSKNELLNMNIRDLRGPETGSYVSTQMHEADNNGILFETIHCRKDGSFFPVEVSSKGTVVNNKRVLLSVIRDITERKQAEANLRQSEEKFRNIVENATEGIFQTTLQGSFISVNPAFVKIIGAASPDEMINNISDIGHQIYANPEDRGKIMKILAKHDYVENFETEARSSDGKKIWMSINAHTVRNQNGDILYFEGTCTDITERKLAEDQLRYLNNRDILTGLYNRNYFEVQMQLLEKYKHIPVGIIMCDIDGLKLVNDTMGHKVGDELLVAASNAIKACFSDDDLIARIGGDEFAVLLPFIGTARLEQTAKRVNAEVEGYNMKNPKLPLSMSIGFAFRQDGSISIYDIFKRADNNMYRKKLRSSQSARSAIVQTLKETMGARDFNTEKHAGRLQELIMAFFEEINITESKLGDLLVFAQFHDIGKVGIPDRILFKPGPLTHEEKVEMQRHPEIGHRIAQSSPDLLPISDLILKHHEWWNGNGYPLGIKGHHIPLECRILAIADAYDAMVSDRPYRKAMSHDEAASELISGKNTQFDPILVDKFIKAINRL